MRTPLLLALVAILTPRPAQAERPLLQADWYLPLSHQFTRQHQLTLREQRQRQATELSQRYLHTND